MTKKKKKTEALTPRRKARRELPSKMLKPTEAQHKLAQEGMARTSTIFNAPLNIQTGHDFGITPTDETRGFFKPEAETRQVTVKLFEIRDRMTTISAMAVKVSGDDGWLLRRAGFDNPLIYLIHLESEQAFYDPFRWPNQRTMGNAHRYIESEWDRLTSGQVIDVEFILGESTTPKVSDQEGGVYGAGQTGEEYDSVLPNLPKEPPEDLSYQEKVEGVKAKVTNRGAVTLAKQYINLRRGLGPEPDEIETDDLVARLGKHGIEELLYRCNVMLVAHEQLLEESKDAQAPGWGMYGVKDNALRLPTGETIRVQGEPHIHIENKEVYRVWCIKHGYEKLMQLWPSRTQTIGKERLAAGEPEPDGCKIYARTTVFFDKAPNKPTEPS